MLKTCVTLLLVFSTIFVHSIRDQKEY